MRGLTEPRSRLEPFFIEYNSTYLHGDLLPKGNQEPPEVLCLYGGGKERRSSFLLLRHVLFEKHSISSCAFDFYEESLDPYRQEYLNQATDIIDACFDSQPFSVVAADLNAEVALQLAKLFPVRQLILLNPPAGCHEARETPCQAVAMPVESTQTLAYLNTNPTLLLKVAQMVKNTLQGDGSHVRCNYKEYG
ncbi:hypothetical protein [Thiothrix fructosivorans]|uniref:Alpha/beta hydrolase n=1 Tax=Thiothrix fructosivorans TaxID=111770 RepID=A0A8B0SG54_9GAMM|nr:hypothetical protein [Thiothrix fructosivorans]MBO0615239.1 hypothetical protein [Thiothrix fructosivorans]QTX10024.1 hypothetical protein J1836_015665 [Thiothrix fructosivorans]